MGACQCDLNDCKNENRIERTIQINSQVNQRIPDLAPAPSYYIGSSHRKKLSTNYKTLGVVPSRDRQLQGNNNPSFEINTMAIMRKKSKRQRIKKNATIPQGFHENIHKIVGHSAHGPDLEMVVGFLEKHFVFGSMNKEEL